MWPGLAKDVSAWARECVAGQRAKITRHVHCAPNLMEMPAPRFQHVNVDLVGPLPLSWGCSNIFTVVDHSTHWFEAFLMASTCAEDCAEVLFSGWIACFGVPEHVTSDQGP